MRMSFHRSKQPLHEKVYNAYLLSNLMIKIYSKIHKKQLLHIICRNGEGQPGKMNHFISEKEVLQVAIGKNISQDYYFGGPHKHLFQERKTNKTQESIIVIRGKIGLIMYDLDDKLIAKNELNEGDCYIYLGGGHSLKILTSKTYFYEIKNGPYYGLEKDKKQLNLS